MHAGSPLTSEILTVLAALHAANATAAPLPAVLVDVGAGSGLYTLIAAALGYPVIAFEADPRRVDAMYQTLCWNPDLRERVTLFPHAAVGAGRTCRIYANEHDLANWHGAGAQMVCEDGAPPAGTLRASAHSVRLGDYLEGAQADVLRIDAEGYEPRVLSGAGAATPPSSRVVHSARCRHA